jgi:GntR family transcriptional regulator
MPIDKQSSISLHIQIRNELLGKILSGELEPGDRISSERELQIRYQVSRSTVRLALRDLTNSGLIYTRPGKGAFVASAVIDPSSNRLAGFTDNSRRDGVHATSKVLLKEIIPSKQLVASRLQIEPEEHVIRIKRLRLADEIPVAMNDTFLPLRLCPNVLEVDLEFGSLYDALRSMDLSPVRAEQMMRAEVPNQEESQLFEIGEGVPVMRIERIAFLSDGRPIEYARSTYRSDKYHFNFLLGRGGDSAYFQGP